MPFEKLVAAVAAVTDQNVTLGQLSRDLGEPIPRIMDAIDVVKMLAGEPTYIELVEPDEQ